MGANIGTDIEGIIRELNLSESEVLFPLFEAVVNSIQSIQERKDVSKEAENVSIYIERDRQDQTIFEKEDYYPIKSIKIIDNGIGFTPANYNSFLKSHSTKKINLGGKGLGRFAILSVFDTIKIKSFFKEKTQDNINACEFELSRKTGITEKEISIPKSARIYTEIELTDINPKYKQATARFTQEYIADSILEHCLLYYLSEDAPVIEVTEDGETINLTNQFNPHDFVKHTEKKKILKYNFTCYYIKNSKTKSHEYFLCAHNRKVKSRRIDSIFPIFTSKVVETNEEYWLQTYVVSNYLDDRVNISRSEIVFPKVKDDDSEDGTIKFGQETRTVIIEKDIDKLVIDGLTTQYAELIDERKQYLQNKVNKFVNSDEGLEYRTLDVDDDFLTSIPDTADEKKLDDIFHEQQYKKYKEIRKKRERLLNKDFSRKKDYQALLKDVVTLTTREGNARLAQYVSHRKTIIDLLERYLEWCEEKNNYKDEATLHNLIFVMGADQNITPYDAHNLWILDDRLSFHRYILTNQLNPIVLKRKKQIVILKRTLQFMMCLTRTTYTAKRTIMRRLHLLWFLNLSVQTEILLMRNLASK